MTALTAEQILLARMIGPEYLASELIPSFSEEMFTGELEKKIFNSTKALNDEGIRPDVVTVAIYGKKHFSFSPIDIQVFYGWAASIVYTTPIDSYVQILKSEYSERELGKAVINAHLQMDKADPFETINNLTLNIGKILEGNVKKNNLLSMSLILSNERVNYYKREELAKAGKLIGLETGVESLNRFLGGWQSEYIILAGATSMGKTAAALFHAMSFGRPGIYFNFEMNESQLAKRIILQNCDDRIDFRNLRDGKLTENERMVFEQTIGKTENTPFKIYQQSLCPMSEIIGVTTSENRAGRCDWIIIDYLQLIKWDGEKAGSRELEIGKISRALKKLQLDLNIPVIALCQLSRAVDARGGNIPRLSDLRESGSLEQDADCVCFVYRPAYYKAKRDDGSEFTNEIQYLFEKNRQGEVGTIELWHNKSMTRFFDAPVEIQTDYQPRQLQPNKSFYETDREEHPF